MSQPLSHTRVPKEARDLCASPAEAACVFLLWDRADEARWEPFRMSNRDFRQGIIGGSSADRLWSDLLDAGLVAVIEPGKGRRPALVVVVNPTTGVLLCPEKGSPGHNGVTTGTQTVHNGDAGGDDQHDASGVPQDANGTQTGRKRDASGASNARAEDSLQPPASNLHGSIPDPSSASEAPSPPEPPEALAADAGSSSELDQQEDQQEDQPPADGWVKDLWGKLDTIRLEHVDGARSLALTAKRRAALKRAARDLRKAGMTREDLLAAARWVHLSESPNASGARDTGNAIDVLLRPSHTVAYAEKAREGVGMPRKTGLTLVEGGQPGPDPRDPRVRTGQRLTMEQERVRLAWGDWIEAGGDPDAFDPDDPPEIHFDRRGRPVLPEPRVSP